MDIITGRAPPSHSPPLPSHSCLPTVRVRCTPLVQPRGSGVGSVVAVMTNAVVVTRPPMLVMLFGGCLGVGPVQKTLDGTHSSYNPMFDPIHDFRHFYHNWFNDQGARWNASQDDYMTDLIEDRALSFIKEQVRRLLGGNFLLVSFFSFRFWGNLA